MGVRVLTSIYTDSNRLEPVVITCDLPRPHQIGFPATGRGPNCILGENRLKGRLRGCSSMVERQLPKLHTRVRFPSPAPVSARPCPIRRRCIARDGVTGCCVAARRQLICCRELRCVHGRIGRLRLSHLGRIAVRRRLEEVGYVGGLCVRRGHARRCLEEIRYIGRLGFGSGDGG